MGDDGTYLSDRGEYRGVYAYVRMNSGETVIEWMSWDDVMVVRSKSPSVQRGKQSPWDDFAGEMARKTVLRRLMKRLPLDSMPQVAHAATLDEEADVIEGQATEVTAAAPGRATAAAYALARGQADEESDQQRTPEKPTEAIVTTAELPSQMCAAPSPYGDGDVCVLAHGHPNNHRSDGGSWS
jgi:recombination protein RecT